MVLTSCGFYVILKLNQHQSVLKSIKCTGSPQPEKQHVEEHQNRLRSHPVSRTKVKIGRSPRRREHIKYQSVGKTNMNSMRARLRRLAMKLDRNRIDCSDNESDFSDSSLDTSYADGKLEIMYDTSIGGNGGKYEAVRMCETSNNEDGDVEVTSSSEEFHDFRTDDDLNLKANLYKATAHPNIKIKKWHADDSGNESNVL